MGLQAKRIALSPDAIHPGQNYHPQRFVGMGVLSRAADNRSHETGGEKHRGRRHARGRSSVLPPYAVSGTAAGGGARADRGATSNSADSSRSGTRKGSVWYQAPNPPSPTSIAQPLDAHTHRASGQQHPEQQQHLMSYTSLEAQWTACSLSNRAPRTCHFDAVARQATGPGPGGMLPGV